MRRDHVGAHKRPSSRGDIVREGAVVDGIDHGTAFREPHESIHIAFDGCEFANRRSRSLIRLRLRSASDGGQQHRQGRTADLHEPDDGNERLRVTAALKMTGGNVARAARRLSLPRTTLRYRIKHYRLQHLIPRD